MLTAGAMPRAVFALCHHSPRQGSGPMFTLSELQDVVPIVRAAMPATPQFAWPLLRSRLGVDIVVKHENHTPIGAFKVRGGLVYVTRLARERPQVRGIVSATRGNHGQSLAFACARAGLSATIVAPYGNSSEKNAAMRALGAELIEHGRDFDDAREHARALARERGIDFAPSFHRDLVLGVATYALELFTAEPELDAVYVPIGLGSGICGLIGTRDALGLTTRIIGVVARQANAYALSLATGAPVATAGSSTFADGMAVRVPDAQALEIVREGAERIVEVSEDEIADAIRILFSDTHNVAEGAGAAALAALIGERMGMAGRRVGVIQTGQNIDRSRMIEVLSGRTPTA
jgi:threonine dehydratase